MKRLLFLAHRWLGLLGCVLIVLWFATGFVMMYVPYPSLLESERLSRAVPIAIEEVRITPARALAAARIGVPASDETQRLRLIQSGSRPVYAVKLATGGWVGIDAFSGTPLHMSVTLARGVGEQFAGVPALGAEPVQPDQWSMQAYLDAHRPLWAVRMADGGVHYLSGRTGEVLRDTSSTERAWNWVGSVVHWVYPTVLRRDARLWHWVVVTLSSYALLVALLGTVIGLLRWRWRDADRRSPYSGWRRWHHLLGLGCAVFALAWLTSGLLSMNPGGVFSDMTISNAQARSWHGGSLDDAAVGRALDAPLPPTSGVALLPAIEVEWWPDGDGAPDALVREAAVRARVQYGTNGQRLWRRGERSTNWTMHSVDAAEIGRRLRRIEPALAGAPVLSIQRLDEEDLYHYRRFDPAPPIWRVRLADAASTWLHVDAGSGELMARLDRSNRVERWAYHGLHSWDFAALLEHRPLWDLLMLPALALGFLFSITSVVVAAQRLAAMRKRARSRIRPTVPTRAARRTLS